VTHPDTPYFDYAYDGLGRMTTIKDNAGATLVTLAYDAAGNRDTATYANGVVTSYDFDAVGRLTSLVHNFAGSDQDVTFGYAYNPASQVVSRTASNDLYSFAQANANVGYTANGLNQLTTVGGGAATYDAKGNLLTEGGRSLGYDSENKLSSIATPQLYNILYDPLGRFRAIATATTTAAFDILGADIVAARISGGATTERYAFGPGTDEPMVAYDSVGTRLFFHADERGSIVARSDSAGSAAGRTYAYDEYGQPSSLGSRFLYAGKMHLGGVNAYYNNARFHDYTLGRFLQPDPIGYGAGMNLYAYVGGDPINLTDHTGLQSNEGEEENVVVVTAKRAIAITISAGATGIDAARYSGQIVGYAINTPGYALSSTAARVIGKKPPKPPKVPAPPKYNAVTLDVRERNIQRWYAEERATAVERTQKAWFETAHVIHSALDALASVMGLRGF
jgi:RHS repeat-associated protein